MSSPPSQVCASWIKTKLVTTDWVLLHDFCFAVIQEKIPKWTEGEIHDYIEEHLPFVAEYLRNEASEWHIDGKLPKYEIDDEESPYIRACESVTRPLLLKLRQMDPFKFEIVCALILNRLGTISKSTKKTNDGGIDFEGIGLKIVPTALGVPTACNAAVVGQAKRYKEDNTVRETQVREFVGAAVLRGQQLRFENKLGPLTPILFAFWTTSDFDANAKKFARASGVWYMDGDTLASYVDHLGLTSELEPV
jgi:restriction endonuclease Mrr